MALVGDIYEARIVSTIGGQTAINIRHYRVSTIVGTGASDSGIATAVNARFATDMKAAMTSNATYRGVGVRRIKPLPVTIETFTIASLGAGTAAGDVLPTQTCGMISLRTLLAGKSRRGRFYVPFPSEGLNDTDGTPTAAYITTLGLLAGDILATLTAGGGGNTNDLVPVVYSRELDLTTDLASTISRDKWATQRSRGDFGRVNPPPF
jgi:hypothetical protein